MATAHIALFASSFALASVTALADDGSTRSLPGSSGTSVPKIGGEAAKGDLRTESPKPRPRTKDKILPGPRAWEGKQPLSDAEKKRWDAMTSKEQAEAQRKWLLRSGDF